MNEHIDPITLQKLQEFNSRRKKLLGLRGLCTFLVAAISIFSILATIDLYVLLADGVRSFLTYSSWVVVITLVWFTSIGKLLQRPTRRELAKYIEQQDPRYREDLLSAIELGVERTDPRNDSPVFRRLLQDDVAQRIKGLDVKNTLPLSLIGTWIKASALLLLLLLGLLLIPDFGKGFSTALGRTMLGANLARVSDITIELLSPDPSETHPEGETIRIKASLNGDKEDLRAVQKVVLETSNSKDENNRTTMLVENDGNYHARLNILTADTKFRIQAGLAQSQWFDLNTAPRPKVESFDITYTPPAYSKLPETSKRQMTKGDLHGIENTMVALRLKANQPISKAELRLDLSTTPANRTIQLEVSKDDPTVLETSQNSLRLFAPGTYRVHLEAQDTGFDNKYSPKYEVSVYPDQAPSLELIHPARNLLVQADELLAVQAKADDDLPIQRIELHLRTNNGRWVAAKLAEATEEDTSKLIPLLPKITNIQYQDTSLEQVENGLPRNALTLSHTLDLLNYTLTPGDRVKLKLVAYDLKKQRTETQPVELTILSRSFESSRIESVAAQARIHKVLASLSESIGKIGDEATEHTQHLKTLNPQDPQSSIQWASFADLAKQIHEDVRLAIEEITEVTRTLPKGTAAREASFTLRTLGRILHDVNTSPPAFIESSREAIDRNESNRFLDEARNRYHESRGRIFSLENQYRAITAGNFRAIIAEDLHNLVKQQHEILPSDQTIQDDPLFWKRLARREQSAINQALTIERNIDRLGNSIIGRDNSTFQKYAHEVAETRKELEKALEIANATQPGPELLAPAKAFKEGLIQFLDKAGSQHNSLYSKAAKEHRYLTTQTEDELHSIYRVLYHARDTYSNRDQEKEQRAKGNTRQANIHAANARHFGRLLSQSTWPGAVGRLKSAAAATEARKDADNQFAQDAGMAALALDNLATQFASHYSMQDGDPHSIGQKVEKFAMAFRKLEHIHQLVDTKTQLQVLANSEKWQLRHPASLIHSPYEWGSAHKWMPDLAKKFKESQLDDNAVRKLSQLQYIQEAKDIKNQMDTRLQSARNPAFRPERQTENLNKIISIINEILQIVEPQAKEARDTIKSLTPTIAELAKELAEKTEKLAEETKQQAKDAEQTQDPETKRADLQQLQDKQEALMADLQDLTNAIRQDANTQDVLTQEGRELARDADDSIAMLTKPANEAEQNLQQANLAQRTEDQVRELNETNEAQQALQQALQQVAEHYENIENPDNQAALAETRQELRAAEEELGIAQQLEEQYSQVERLAELSQLDPEQLLAALETELDKNRLMQTQLSDITEDTLQETKENLEAAAKEEAQIPDQLAKSDTETRKETQGLAQQLNQIGQEARKISREEVNQANQAARQAQDASTADQLEQARNDLDRLGRQAEDAARSSNPREIAETAQNLVTPLEELAKKLEDAAKDASTLKETNAQNAQQKADQAKKQAEELTQKANQAVDKANALAEKANAAREDAIQAQQELLTANDLNPSASPAPIDNPSQTKSETEAEHANVNPPASTPDTNQAPQDPASNTQDTGSNTLPPESGTLQPVLTPDQAEEKFNQAVAKAQQAQQEAKQAQQGANDLREQANQANREATAAQNLANQFKDNPGKANEILNQAQQAQQKAGTASDKTENLARQAKALAEQLAQAVVDISPTESALDQANSSQESINNAAENASQDLARAARHEERLGNQDIAKELDNLAQNTAQALDKPVEGANEQLLNLDAQNQLSDLAKAAKDIANDEAAKAQQSAQQADQSQLGQDIAQSAKELDQAAQQAQQTSQQQSAQQSEIAKAAKQLSQELAQAAQEFAQQAQQAQQAAQDIQQPSRQAAQQAQQAQQAANQAQQAAQQASQSIQQAQQANQQAQQAQQAAQQAQQQAQLAQQQAQQAADNAAQDPAAAEQAQQNAEQAAQQAQSAQQTATQAQQLAQQTSAEAAQQAQQAAQAARQAAQQAQEAQLANQAPQPAQTSAREAKQAAEAAQQAAQAAQNSAQQAAQSAQLNEGNPVSQQAAQIAAQAAENATQAAQQAAEAAQQAQSAKDSGTPDAQAQTQAASNDAQAAAQVARQAAQEAAQAAQLAANPQAQPLQLAEQAGQQAQQNANQAQQSASQAQASAQGQQAKAKQPANAANNAAQEAQSAADQAAALAQQAGELAQGLEAAQPNGNTPFDQPFAEASQALSQQAQNLENFFNEGLAQSQSPALPASPSLATPASPASHSSTPASPTAQSQQQASPFTNPETSQALAQTLDAVDQAVTEAQAAATAAESPSGAQGESAQGTPAEGGQLAEAASGQAAHSPSPGQPAPGTESSPSQGTPAPGQPAPGQPAPGSPSPGSAQPGAPAPGSPSQSLAQAAQALAQAAAAQAAAMSQARNASQMPGQNPIGKGFQLTSESGAAITAGPLAYQKLEEANRRADLDWGKLPTQMAKDLMEGSQEDISGEYRQQVQTYFRAIAELARKSKDEK